MEAITVLYYLSVGGRKFKSKKSVFSVPHVGSHIKAANYSFVVTEHEQDLDSYDDTVGTPELAKENNWSCETVSAGINGSFYDQADFDQICSALLKAGWIERK